jgi:hypothetical protein
LRQHCSFRCTCVTNAQKRICVIDASLSVYLQAIFLDLVCGLRMGNMEKCVLNYWNNGCSCIMGE